MNTTGRTAGEPLLVIEGLCTWFFGERGIAKAVDGVSLTLRRGETLALVGESGSGKSVTALSILRLIDDPPGRIVAGSVRLRGRELLALDADALRAVRGREIAIVFQDPLAALDPLFTIGEQIAETLCAHMKIDRRAARARAIELCDHVGLPRPEHAVDLRPHELSGGMRQRALIAIAIACAPSVLIADEPTTALDVTIQAAILALLRELRASHGLGMLLITHDLAVAAENADRIAVMYAGKIVEEASARELLARPGHPYTIGLLRSLPSATKKGERALPIAGQVPSATDWPSGCRFRTRCPIAQSTCVEIEPALLPLSGEGANDAHRSACHFTEEAARL